MTDDLHEAARWDLEITSQSAEQTQLLGAGLGELLQGGELLLLGGELGAGKTTFTQGLAKGMGITAMVNSPTFTLLKEYRGRAYPSSPNKRGVALYHFDLYRLDDPDEMIDLGFEDYFSSTGVCVVEWANKAESFWPAERLVISLKTLDERKRLLLFTATGAQYCKLLQQFQKNMYASFSS